MGDPIRVAIVDDDEQSRQAVREWFDRASNVEIVGERPSGPEILRWLRRVQPEVLLLDVAALSVEQIREAASWAKIVILHVEGQEPSVLEALRGGALGHLDKANTRPSQAIAAVRAVRRGTAFLSPAMAGRILGEVSARRQQNQERR